MKTNQSLMRQAILALGTLILIAGCNQDLRNDDSALPTIEVKEAEPVSFKVGEIQTRTAYTNDGTSEKERIDWVENDVITLWSDNAVVPSDVKLNYADYKVGADITADGAISSASIAPAGETLLRWANASNYQFWGVYPASKTTLNMKDDKVDAVNPGFTATIPAAYAATDLNENSYTSGETTVTKYEPNMDHAFMVTYLSTPRVEAVTLPFNPAFTAFEFHLKSADADFTLNSFTLSSEATTEGGTAMPIAGDFVATCANGTWSYTAAEGNTTTAITVAFPENTVVSKNDEFIFTVFALPTTLSGLKMSFNINDNITKSLRMRSKGVWREFEGCYKHRINGIALPTGWYFSYVGLNLEVIEWTETEYNDVSTGNNPQATQFNVQGANNLRTYLDGIEESEDNKAWRQYWYFSNGEEVTLTYKVMLPAGATWQIVPAGDTAKFDISGATSGEVAAAGTYVQLKIKAKSATDTAQYAIRFNTYVTKGGTTYNIDSETQLYDLRGYHYFILNPTAAYLANPTELTF